MTVAYVLDGKRITDLDSFWRVMGEAVGGPGGYFGRGLDSFTDCLRGGFGTPEDGDFTIEWRDHDSSRAALGHEETAHALRRRVERAHPDNLPRIREELGRAEAGQGPTVFDWLVQVMEESGHPPLLR